jgi:hypothetical protein
VIDAISRIFPCWSPRARRLERLAVIAAQSEDLSLTLARHAEQCDYPALKPGLEKLAGLEAADSRKLRAILLARGTQPATLDASASDGANNWARINADLAAEIEILRALTAAIAEWQGPDPKVAEELQAMVEAKESMISRLRDLGLKSDPHALD